MKNVGDYAFLDTKFAVWNVYNLKVVNTQLNAMCVTFSRISIHQICI